MKRNLLQALAICLVGTSLSTIAQTNLPAVLFPDDDPLTPENWKLVWPATPGLRYEVQQSTNLQTWITAPGYPAPAGGPAQQMPFQTTGNSRFFKVKQLDEQPPASIRRTAPLPCPDSRTSPCCCLTPWASTPTPSSSPWAASAPSR